ncbi:hypothetical protein S2091_1992 [Solimicrobium silvestre]|uniref:Uncharacterized protein n=1 Tax=Solimicrobium silvestre TaxID=2099400 RepID=A0A2S9GZU6_9BURK|nr:hypothetical protein S2091_1992 [Solimicrobium silvestre]
MLAQKLYMNENIVIGKSIFPNGCNKLIHFDVLSLFHFLCYL